MRTPGARGSAPRPASAKRAATALGHLEAGLGRHDDDLADLGPGDPAAPAEERQDPLRVGLLLPADGEAEPGRPGRRAGAGRARAARAPGRRREPSRAAPRRPAARSGGGAAAPAPAPPGSRPSASALAAASSSSVASASAPSTSACSFGVVLGPDRLGGRHRRPGHRAPLASRSHPLQLVALRRERTAAPPRPCCRRARCGRSGAAAPRRPGAGRRGAPGRCPAGRGRGPPRRWPPGCGRGRRAGSSGPAAARPGSARRRWPPTRSRARASAAAVWVTCSRRARKTMARPDRGSAAR